MIFLNVRVVGMRAFLEGGDGPPVYEVTVGYSSYRMDSGDTKQTYDPIGIATYEVTQGEFEQIHMGDGLVTTLKTVPNI